MLKMKTMVAAMAAALMGLGLSQSALAQDDTAQSDGFTLDEIIVTSTKREESIYDVPIAITAFTAEAIEVAGITNLVDIGKFVPNLNVTEFSAGHTASVNPFIRG
ncbi:MAG TPA: hypothetical protein VI566_14475, partial [Xanthomonadales bacterium]|nr:hypothetical protein [Xanthomonadales bacterium]